jgi:hypothetical protein
MGDKPDRAVDLVGAILCVFEVFMFGETPGVVVRRRAAR